MAHAIQVVRGSDRAVPEQSFRIREPRPIILYLPVIFHRCGRICSCLYYLMYSFHWSPTIWKRCKLIYYCYCIKNACFRFLCCYFGSFCVHPAAPHMSQVWYLQKIRGAPSCMSCALWLETFALNACVNNLTSVMWSGLSDRPQWKLLISCSLRGFLYMHDL